MTQPLWCHFSIKPPPIVGKTSPFPRENPTIPGYRWEVGPGGHFSSCPATGRAFRLLRRMQDNAVPSHPCLPPSPPPSLGWENLWLKIPPPPHLPGDPRLSPRGSSSQTPPFSPVLGYPAPPPPPRMPHQILHPIGFIFGCGGTHMHPTSPSQHPPFLLPALNWDYLWVASPAPPPPPPSHRIPSQIRHPHVPCIPASPPRSHWEEAMGYELVQRSGKGCSAPRG